MTKHLPILPLFLFLVVWAMPALAGDPDIPSTYDLIPARAQSGLVGAIARGDMAPYRATLSGTLLGGEVPGGNWSRV
jgi:hypothetical protein